MNWKTALRDKGCTLCPLHASTDNVCIMGVGKRTAKYMIVGEAPGEQEERDGEPFVGRSGALLREALRDSGLDLADAYITNVAKCRPPDNRNPTKQEARACGDTYLTAEIEQVQPDYILAVGNTPLQALVGRSGITKHRGALVANVFPTFHPAYVLRSPQHEPTFRADVDRFARLVRGEGAKAAPTRVKIIRTRGQLKWLLKQLREASVIAFDLETTGLEEYRDDSKIVCLSLTWQSGLSAVVPLWHDKTPWSRPDRVLGLLKPLLEDSSKKYVAHNGKFDCRWLAAFGVYVPLTFDTMLAAHLLDENRAKGLKPLSQILLGADAYDVGEDIRQAYTMPMKKLCVYAAKDTDYTYRLYEIFKAQLKEQPRLARIFAWLMVPGSNVLTKVEQGGMWVDNDRLDKQTALARRKKQEVLDQLLSYVPTHKRETINFNSPQQVASWLFGDLKLPLIEQTATGNPSTNESVMLRLATKHEAPAMLLEYRKYTKYLNTYLEPWKERQDARSRIHTNYKLFGTVTGRLSSEKPNLQQVPRDGTMRTCFGAPQGYSFVEADYSQVELRVAAMLARDRTLLRIFATGGDPHLATAAQVSGLTPDEVLRSDKEDGTEHRKKAKGVNFGFLYGMGAAKFVDYARDSYGVEVTPDEAVLYRARFFELYSALPAWHARQRRLVEKYGHVHSPLGRVRHLPSIWSSDQGVQEDAKRQAINSPVQSFASDLMLLSMIRLDGLLQSSRARIIGTVHDALMFEVRDDYLDTALPIIRDTMQDLKAVKRKFGAEITVPIEVEIKVGSHWGSGKVWNGS